MRGITNSSMTWLAAPRGGASRPRSSTSICIVSVLQTWRQNHMSAQVDAATVRQFIEIISAHAAQVINGADRTGVLQLCRIHPLDEKSVVPSRFGIDDVEEMVKTAIGDANAGHNVYIEARTVREDLRGTQARDNRGNGLGFRLRRRLRCRQRQGRQRHRQADFCDRDLAGKFPSLVPARPCYPGRAGQADRRRHSRELRRRPGHRRRHPVLPRGRHAELSLSGQASARAYRSGGHQDLRAHRPAVGSRRAVGDVLGARIGIPGCPRPDRQW